MIHRSTLVCSRRILSDTAERNERISPRSEEIEGDESTTHDEVTEDSDDKDSRTTEKPDEHAMGMNRMSDELFRRNPNDRELT